MSFPGPIQEISGIRVDNFTDRRERAYFLSHVHSDHYEGLYSRDYLEELVNKAGKIYMTKESKRIAECFVWDMGTSIMDLMEPLKTGMVYTIELDDDTSFQVTLIPVTHMVGAVMFLFKTDTETILYTGDFLIENDDLHQLTELHNNGTPVAIDAMYIDTTFDTDHIHFPIRSSVVNEATNKITNWLRADENNGVALYHYTKIGYEDLYRSISNETGIKLYWNNDAIYELFSDLYGNDNPLSPTDQPTRIHICKNKKHDASHYSCGADHNLNYLYIYISAERGCFYLPGEESMSIISSDRDMYLCFPTHCSKSQRDAFEEYFPSTRVVRFPRSPLMQPPREWSNVICPYRDIRDRERELVQLFSLLAFNDDIVDV